MCNACALFASSPPRPIKRAVRCILLDISHPISSSHTHDVHHNDTGTSKAACRSDWASNWPHFQHHQPHLVSIAHPRHRSPLSPSKQMLVLRRTSSSSTRTSSGSSSRLLQQRWPWGQHQQPQPRVPLAAVALSSSASGVYHSPHDHPLLQACRSSTHTYPRLPLSSSSSTRFSTNSASVGGHL